MFDIQSMLNVVGEQNQITRSKYHITLDKLINKLEESPGDYLVSLKYDNN